MDDPDVILGVDAEANHLTEHPVVGQGLRPERIDLEARRLERTPILRIGRTLEHMAPPCQAPTIDTRNADPISRSRSLDHLLTNFCRRLPSKFSPV